MSTYYLELPGNYGRKVGNEGGADAVRLLMTEFANIESFIEEALGGKTAADAIDAVSALSDFMRFSGHGTPRVLQQARSAARNSGDAKRESNCLECLGDLTLARSQHDEARRRYEEALPLYVQVGDVLGRANCIQGLGDIALAHSQPEQARQLFERSLSLYMSISDPYSIGMTHRRLARLASDATERRHHITAARQAWESINRPDLVQGLHDEFDDAQ
ncbi:MAG TPA: tetratricopeptide repeat protein [Myxococcaceae bacterium]|nr:tetratricopeptide repeat protein [Myxococcaceae bacterium]